MNKVITLLITLLASFALCLGVVSSCTAKDNEEEIQITPPNGEESLSTPDGITILELTPETAIIQWNPVEEATHYRFKWNKEGSMDSGMGYQEGNDATIANISHLEPGATYLFRVRGENMNILYEATGGPYPLCSDWSEAVSFTTPTL